MKRMTTRLAILLLSTVSLLVCAYGQSTPSSEVSAAVPPPLIQFSGVATDEGGNPLSGVVNITFTLYSTQQGGEPLWSETQNNIQLDPTGHYSVELGLTKPSGMPTALFTTTEARWLGVQIDTQAQQPRILLLSVPYALKAGDAATIGGLPPSAFVLATPPSGYSPEYTTGSATTPSAPPPSSAITGTGTVNYLPLWDTTSDITSSVLFQSGKGSTAKIGINTTTPASTLDVKGSGTVRGTLSLPATGIATASKGANSQPLAMAASAYNSGTGAAVTQTFQWQAEPIGNDTSTAAGSLNLLFAQGTNKPAETGLHIGDTGQITFAAGQTFPGTGSGTVSSVGSGSGLTGGPITSSGTLSIATGGVTNAMLVSPSLTVAAGTDLTGGGSVALGNGTTLNLDTTKVPQLSAANVFTGNQTVNGNLSATGVVTGSSFQIGSNLFAFGSYSNQNAFLGFAGNPANGGSQNTAVGVSALAADAAGMYNTAAGWDALLLNTSGNFNTAIGVEALAANTGDSQSHGSYNTASGYLALVQNTLGGGNTATGIAALQTNTTGNENTGSGQFAGRTHDNSFVTGLANTFLGSESAMGTGSLNNATAIGANAEVDVSNALVLGSINGINGASASVNVGIGTTTPAATLDVHGTGNFTGLITFAPGQTFPGTGTISGVTAGTGLSGGGTSGSVTLNVDTTKVMTGVTAGTDLTGGGTGGVQLLNLDTTKVPQLAASNTFVGNQTVSGNVSATGFVAASGFQIASNLFVYGSYAAGNAFLGFAGNPSTTGNWDTASGALALIGDTTGILNTANGYKSLEANTTGSENTAIGAEALASNTQGSSNTATGIGALGNNTTGFQNTAAGINAVLGNTTGFDNTGVGAAALSNNTTGSQNVAVGWESLGANTTGINNTAIGAYSGQTGDLSLLTGASNIFVGLDAGPSTGTISNSIAIGVLAQVSESNALVLGPVNGVNGSSVDTLVGIGTTAPRSKLDVDDNLPNALGPVLTLTNNGGGGQVAVDFNTYQPSTQGTYNPAARIAVYDSGGYTDTIFFQANQSGNPNQGLRATMSIDPFGNVYVYGSLAKASGSFKIDHPQDPANKYLYHSFVESPDMMNIYNGVAALDAQGAAWITLPEYFEALNQDFRYQLTAMGRPQPSLYVAKEIAGNRFKVAGVQA